MEQLRDRVRVLNTELQESEQRRKQAGAYTRPLFSST